MIDTQESDLAPAVAATIGPLHTTRRGLVHPGMFAEIETGEIVSGPGYFRSHTALRTLSRAEREAKSFSTRSSAAPKKWDTTRGNMSGIVAENILSPLLAAPLVATKISTTPRTSCARSVQEILTSRPGSSTNDRAVTMTRSTER